MQARVITLRFSSMLEGFDDAPLRDFIKDKEVHALRDHFFVRNDIPFLAVMVSYSPMPAPKSPPVAVAGQPARNKRDESWRHLISEGEVPLFNSLRGFSEGLIGEDELARSVGSMLGHIRHADTLAARRQFFSDSPNESAIGTQRASAC